MKIGLGISTTEKRTISRNVYDFISPNTHIVEYVDRLNFGVSHSRNRCLSILKEYDYIFLMDDDCYPLMSGWEDYFISIAEKYGFNHFTLPEAFKTNIVRGGIDYHEYDGAIGAFRFMTKKCLETVGGFNSAYNRYGFEDAGYTHRVHKSKINGDYQYISPARSTAYIFSEDVYARNPTPNLTREEKQVFIEKNLPIYAAEINGDKIFYPYE